PGPTSKIKSLQANSSPTDIIDQAVKQPTGIDIQVQLPGKIPAKEMLSDQGKACQLGSGATLHGAACCLKKPAAVEQIQLRYIDMTEVIFAIIQHQVHAGNSYLRIGQPATGKIEPGLQLVIEVSGALKQVFNRFGKPATDGAPHSKGQPVRFKVFKYNSKAQERRQEIQPKPEMLKLGHRLTGVRVDRRDCRGRYRGVKPLP